MNGFTNAVLTILLGWLRSLFNAIWAALSSDGNGALVGFLSSQWKTIFVVLCVGGFVVDRIVYLIRWRPYYVWLYRRKNRKRRFQQNAVSQPNIQSPSVDSTAYARPAEEAPLPDEDTEPTLMYQPPSHAINSPGFAPAYRYVTPAAGALRQTSSADPSTFSQEDAVGATLSYRQSDANPYTPPVPAPSAESTEPYAVPYRVPEGLDDSLPSGRDSFSEWEQPHGGFQDFAPRVVAKPSPSPEPPAVPAAEPGRIRRVNRMQSEQYLRDVRSGFAPAPTPEQLYTQDEEPAVSGPIHPGLDLETFQQNIGLNREDIIDDYTEPDEMSAYPNFVPFSAAQQAAEKTGKLGTLAKKARSFVRGEDENNPPSIHDLQTTVDVSNAFHAPVYPKKNPESGEE